MRHVSTIHRGQSILSLQSLKLLNTRNVLNENDDGVDVLVLNVLHALLINLIALSGSERYRHSWVLHAHFEDLEVGLEIFLAAKCRKFPVHISLWHCTWRVIVKTHLVLLLAVQGKVCYYLVNTIYSNFISFLANDVEGCLSYFLLE